MTRRSLTLVQAIFIVLVISLAAPAARSQQQEQPGVQPQEKPAAEPSQQKPAETAPEQRQGEVIIPEQGESAPEHAEAPPQKTPQKAAEGGTYTIKQGDTLWDISNTFLKDPFLWPFIWKANQYITNPDLIYPGNRLAIPSLAPIERALQAPAVPREQLVEKQTTTAAPPAEEHAAVNKFIVPEEAPIPVVNKYSMMNAGFISLEESKDIIEGSKERKTIFGYDDIVYVTINSKEAAVGDKFIIYTLLKKVKHPVTGKNYGRLTKVLGVLQLTEMGAPGTYAARITISFNFAEIGNMLTPYQEPTLIYNTAQAKPKDISGYILEVMDGRTINAQTDIVYLDKGSDDGVDAGDRFVIYAKPQKKKYPKEVIGEAQVFLVKEHTATAVVTKSANVIVRGDEVAYKK
ncbi:MAG TPA: LysM peptidoglycan-binding domain-containing protein [Nitrospirota bacterium]|nr:LysM peptidoglycan-binding domain-containing protein [Nitrospirota bacterium]